MSKQQKEKSKMQQIKFYLGLNDKDTHEKEIEKVKAEKTAQEKKAYMYHKTDFNGTPSEVMTGYITKCPHCGLYNAWHHEFKYCTRCGRSYLVDTTAYDNLGEIIKEDK